MITWGELKQRLEAEGVKDDDQVNYLNIDGWAEFRVVIEEKEGKPRRVRAY